MHIQASFHGSIQIEDQISITELFKPEIRRLWNNCNWVDITIYLTLISPMYSTASRALSEASVNSNHSSNSSVNQLFSYRSGQETYYLSAKQIIIFAFPFEKIIRSQFNLRRSLCNFINRLWNSTHDRPSYVLRNTSLAIYLNILSGNLSGSIASDPASVEQLLVNIWIGELFTKPEYYPFEKPRNDDCEIVLDGLHCVHRSSYTLIKSWIRNSSRYKLEQIEGTSQKVGGLRQVEKIVATFQ